MALAATSFEEAVYEPFTRSSTEEGIAVLQERFSRDGYLYLPAALRASVAPVLSDMLSVLAPHIHWDDSVGTPVLAGEPFFESDPLWDSLYPEIQALESLHRLFHSAEVQQLMALVAGEETFVYPMKMARIAAPRKLGFETPPHQDAFSHHAGPSMAGIWVALHDADTDMGRLTILPGSHVHGVRKVFEAQGVGGVQCEIYPKETLWHVSDVTAGDVILFHSQTVHRAQPNVDAKRVRLSIDTRFCDYGAPVFSTNLEPHHGWRIPRLDWDYVYRDWQQRDLCHYWRDYPALF
ncbi:phytanoyl-CoA dioxygenase family protein [Congregibacter sp.]|uniref:phytanoyl-CoA dioxygenase family protein n=1 Tax=Congregibacter sp. TaxID=2744308 RepID=UPI00385C18B7